MGNQPDGLLGMEQFDGNETRTIWPAWKLDLDRRITFEFGEVGVDIVDGRITEDQINSGDGIEDIQLLLNSLTPKTRAQVQFKSEWIEQYTARIPQQKESNSDEDSDSDSDSDSDDSDDDKKDKTKPATMESSSEEEKEEKRLRLTFIGAMNVKAAIERLKSSYFLSIEKHGIVVG